jgi:hypothetical protein
MKGNVIQNRKIAVLSSSASLIKKGAFQGILK